MNNIENNKWKVRGAVVAIFLLGFVAGILALNVYKNLSGGGRQQSRDPERAERFFEGLGLTEPQLTEVRGILDDARNQMREMRRADGQRRREIRRQTDERLQKILTPEQWQSFQQTRGKPGDRNNGGKKQDRD